MSSFNEKEYFAVLIVAIQAERPVPFDCYVVLSANQRVVLFNPKNEILPQNKLDRLTQHQFTQLFVHISDYDAYKNYLVDFLTSEKGKSVVNQILEAGDSGNLVIEGIPDDVIQKIRVGDGISEQDSQTEHSNEVREEVMQLLKENVSALDDQFSLKASWEGDDETVISQIAEKLSEDLVRVRKLKKEDLENNETVIKDTFAKVKEEVLRIKGVGQSKDSDRYQMLGKYADTVLQRVEEYEKEIFNPEESDAEKRIQKRLGADIWKVKRLAHSKNQAILSDTLSDMIESVQEVIGTQLSLPDKAVAFSKEVAGKTPKEIQSIVAAQYQRILDLKRRLGEANDALGNLKQKWAEFETSGRHSFDQATRIHSEKIGVVVGEVSSLLLGVNQSSEDLSSLSEKLNDRAGLTAEDLSMQEGETPPMEQPQDEATPDEFEATGDDDSIRTENKLLQAQLENAKSLFEANERKFAEQEKLLASHGSYVVPLEEEVRELRKTVASMQEKLDAAEEAKDRLTVSVQDADRSLQLEKSNEKMLEDNAYNLKDRIVTMEQTLELYEGRLGDVRSDPRLVDKNFEEGSIPPDLMAALSAKDRMIAKLNEHMAEEENKKRDSRQEMIRLQNQLQRIDQLKQQMGHKFEKLKQERDVSRKAEEALNRKIAVLTNLQEESRSVVQKLTVVNEELRRDRLLYIGKTNQALKDFKEMVSKANSLNSHVQAEVQRNKTILEQNDILKAKQKEMLTQYANLQKEFKALENESVRLRRIAEQGNTALAAPVDQNPKILEARLSEAKKENEELQSKLKNERRKMQDLIDKFKKVQAELLARNMKKKESA